ncbi:hypothetical protein JVT61DRAFT_12422 [Boletus reticuloceps]|uniref:Uncharacterized protein n=1 Tax=Boletus reticuloceps TaxID=495285 RepID=A0A8I2YE29_9AGAM|nr:hypothetical protein JVT61DRAFT_12422 [Boletus reticuloceps]
MSGLNIDHREVQPACNANAKLSIVDEKALPTKGRSKGKECADVFPSSRVTGQKVMDREVEPIGDTATISCVGDEEVPPAKACSKGQERANVIPGPRRSVASITDTVGNIAGHHTVQSHEALLPPDSHPPPSSLRHPTTSKNLRSKGKRKGDISKSVEAPRKGSATISEPTLQAPASAGMDNGHAFTFSMRPQKQSIVQQKKARLKLNVENRQPTPGPSKARSVKVTDWNPTPGPSNTVGHRQTKMGPLVEEEKMGIPSKGPSGGPNQDANKVLHDAYKEVPIVPLQHPDGQSKAAQPNHHKKGLPLRSAMKKKASSSGIPNEHTVQRNAEGSSNRRASETPGETPMADINAVRKVVQGHTEAANASRNMDTTGSKSSEQKRWMVKRIPDISADQSDQAQVSFTSK